MMANHRQLPWGICPASTCRYCRRTFCQKWKKRRRTMANDGQHRQLTKWPTNVRGTPASTVNFRESLCHQRFRLPLWKYLQRIGDFTRGWNAEITSCQNCFSVTRKMKNKYGNLFPQFREGWLFQIGWIFRKIPNGLRPRSHFRKIVLNFFRKRLKKALYKGPKSAI